MNDKIRVVPSSVFPSHPTLPLPTSSSIRVICSIIIRMVGLADWLCLLEYQRRGIRDCSRRESSYRACGKSFKKLIETRRRGGMKKGEGGDRAAIGIRFVSSFPSSCACPPSSLNDLRVCLNLQKFCLRTLPYSERPSLSTHFVHPSSSSSGSSAPTTNIYHSLLGYTTLKSFSISSLWLLHVGCPHKLLLSCVLTQPLRHVHTGCTYVSNRTIQFN